MDELVETLKKQIIEALSLEESTPDDIDPAAALFGAGLGLDSIDALELVVMVEKHYGIRITELEVGRQAFSSVNTLADFIRKNREPCGESE